MERLSQKFNNDYGKYSGRNEYQESIEDQFELYEKDNSKQSKTKSSIYHSWPINVPFIGWVFENKPKGEDRERFVVTVKEIGEYRSICEVDFRGLVTEVSFPTSVLNTKNLIKHDRFEWFPSGQHGVQPDDCMPLSEFQSVDEQKERRFMSFLRGLPSIFKKK